MKLFLLSLIFGLPLLGQKIDPNFTKGLAAYNSFDQEEGIKYFEKVIKKDSTNAKAYMYIGAIKIQTFSNDFDVIEYFNKAISLDSNLAEAYHYRSITTNDNNAALKDVTKAISLDSMNSMYYHNRSNFRLDLKNYEGSIADAKKCFEINPMSSPFLYLNISNGYLGLKKYQTALKFVQIFMDKDGESHGLVVRGNIYFEMENFTEALVNYEKYQLTSDPILDGGHVLIKIGKTKLKLNDQTGACIAFKEAISLGREIEDEFLKNCK